MKKYAVHPGWIGNAWFSFERLIELYDVPKEECIEWDGNFDADVDNYIHLHPRADGVYHSPEKEDPK